MVENLVDKAIIQLILLTLKNIWRQPFWFK